MSHQHRCGSLCELARTGLTLLRQQRLFLQRRENECRGPSRAIYARARATVESLFALLGIIEGWIDDYAHGITLNLN